jgi:diguanylate cyclase (GGDEF)-like protein
MNGHLPLTTQSGARRLGRRRSEGPVMRAALVLFLLLGALLSAVVLTLIRNADHANAQQAATQLATSARIAASSLSTLHAELQTRAARLASSSELRRAVLANDRGALERIARKRSARIFNDGTAAGALPRGPKFTSTASIISGSGVLARVTVALPLDTAMLRLISEATPLPSGGLLLLTRRERVIAGGLRDAQAAVRQGRVVLGSVPFAAQSAGLPVAGIRVVAAEPLSDLSTRNAAYRQRTLIAAIITLLLIAALAVRFARPLARKLGELSAQAERDPLTGLANRRLLDARLEEELDRARRYHTHLAFVLIDIDDFKQVNDRYGHQAGDDALQAFAKVLSSSVRELDLAGRLGGEEFALVLPGTPVEGACRVAENIRRAAAAVELEGPAGETIRFTASFGAAAFPICRTVDDLIERADQCVYEAKRRGKNQVIADTPSQVAGAARRSSSSSTSAMSTPDTASRT